ncbi:MAG: UTP--glucose-1-phosphate uridylyltransferase, partial [Caldilineaceae bacterium]|nr:UTP--glucose-1-phosphate uridylyltransferase [Caldilineaceae bacterium]
LDAGIDEIGVVVRPGDEAAYAAVVGDHAGRLHFIQQTEPLGYGHAVLCAREFVGTDAFLHLVGDHLYVSNAEQGCAQRLVQVAEANECAVSAVQSTRESLLPYYGAIGGKRLAGQLDLYQIDTVIEKPTPTEAEQRLNVPGLRAGHYLCFFGMHVLTPTVMTILDAQLTASTQGIPLAPALDELARREQYLALAQQAQRFDVGVKYGLLSAQIALALHGKDRDEVLTRLLELLAVREMNG